MKYIFNLFFSLQYIFFSCNFISPIKKSITVIKIKITFPLVNSENGHIDMFSDSCYRYSFNECILIRVPASYSEYSNNGSVYSKSTRYMNFFYKKGNSMGLKFDSLTSVEMRLFNVDSLLKDKTFKGMSFFSKKNDSLVSSNTVLKNIRVNKYIPRIKYDSTYCDTTVHYFNNKTIVNDFSLSPELDSISKSNLFKVQFIYKSIKKSVKLTVPKRIITFEYIPLDSITNGREIENLKKRFLQYSPN